MKNRKGKCEGRNKGLPEKTKGTRAKEKKQRLGGEMTGADRVCKGNVSCTSYSRTFYDTQMATANCVHPHAQLEQP